MTEGNLVQRWEHFVREVERGYDLTIYDYTNDLQTRDELARANDATVEPLDARFRATTRPASRPLPGAPDDAAWWWTRVPLRPSGELAADIKAEGL